jgi:hypothetical protein
MKNYVIRRVTNNYRFDNYDFINDLISAPFKNKEASFIRLSKKKHLLQNSSNKILLKDFIIL